MSTLNRQQHPRIFFAEKLFHKPKRLRSNLNHLLNLVLPELPTPLMDRGARKAWKNFGRHLPLAGKGGFEMELKDSERKENLVVMISEEEAARFARLDLKGMDSPVWRSIPQFCQWWMGHGLDVAHIHLEMDAGNLPSHPQSISVGFSESPSARRMTEILGFFSSRFTPSPALQDFLNALPNGTKVFQTALVLSEGKEHLRLSTRGFDQSSLNDFLHSIGLPGLAHFPASAANHFQISAVHFHIAERISPCITLEVKTLPGEHWEILLSELVKLGLCTHAKKFLVLDFKGRREADAMNALWKQVGSSSFREGAEAKQFVRWGLDHIKLTAGPDTPIQAKARLHFGRSSHPAQRTAASLNPR